MVFDRFLQVMLVDPEVRRSPENGLAGVSSVREMHREAGCEIPWGSRHTDAAENAPPPPNRSPKNSYLTQLIISCLTPFFLAGCSLIDPHNMIGRQMGEATGVPTQVVPPPASAALDRAARERAFDFVWETIERRYYDPTYHGVDWRAVGERYRPLALAAPDDEAFWDVLDRMTGELRDAHTRVESPLSVELRKHEESVTFGFSFAPLGGKLVVTSVFVDSDAWWAGVRSGMRSEER